MTRGRSIMAKKIPFQYFFEPLGIMKTTQEVFNNVLAGETSGAAGSIFSFSSAMT